MGQALNLKNHHKPGRVDHLDSIQWNSCQIAVPHCQWQACRYLADVLPIGVSGKNDRQSVSLVTLSVQLERPKLYLSCHSGDQSRDHHTVTWRTIACFVASVTRHCRTCLPILLSPEARLGERRSNHAPRHTSSIRQQCCDNYRFSARDRSAERQQWRTAQQRRQPSDRSVPVDCGLAGSADSSGSRTGRTTVAK